MSKVIVIDDEPAVRHVLVEILTSQGFAAVGGATGEDLERLLAEHPDAEAVVCDYSLVRETGLDVRARVRATLEARRVAFLMIHGSGDLLSPLLRELGIREIRKPPEHIRDVGSAVREEISRTRAIS